LRITQLVYWPLVTLQFFEFTLLLILQLLSCRPGYGAQGAKSSRKSCSAPPCASVGWSTFLAVLPFISVRPSGRLDAQDEGLKSVIHSDTGYCGSRKLATARRQNHLVLAALLYTRASSSCHLVKLPVGPLMALPSFSGVFYIRDLWISGKMSPCLRGM